MSFTGAMYGNMEIK